MKENNKTAFVTFSTKYLKTTVSPTYSEFVSVVKEAGFLISHEWYAKENGRTPEEIHSQALKAIREADYLIAEASIDSIGVGQQINYALQKKKVVVLCVKKDMATSSSSTFLKGTNSGNIKFVYYDRIEDLAKQLKQIFIETDKIALEKFNFIATPELKAIISKESQKRQISQSELLRNIIEEWSRDK